MAGNQTIMLDAATTARLRGWADHWPELAVVLAARPAGPVHLVGGVVRDLLLGRAPKDVDLVVPDGVGPLAGRLATRLGGARVPLHDAPPTERVALAAGRSLDLAAYRGPDLEADLRARDFTVNAMALDLTALLDGRPLRLIDPTGGWADLRRGVVRLAGPTALSADPLRLLRAYRLLATAPRPAAGGRWRLAPATATAIRRHRRGLSRPARERIAAELLLIFASPRAWSVVRALAGAGLLDRALPPLAARDALRRPGRTSADRSRSDGGRRSPVAGRYAAGRIGFQVLRFLGRVRRDPASVVGASDAGRLALALDEELSNGRPRAALLGWLALTLATGDARRFHSAQVMDLVSAVGDSLRAGRREAAEARRIARITTTIDLLAPPPTALAERDRREALAALGQAAPGALVLAWARDRGRRTEELRAELERYWRVIEPLLAAPPLLDGATLMRDLGLAPGPALGDLLKAVTVARVRGEIDTPQAALTLARHLLDSSPTSTHP